MTFSPDTDVLYDEAIELQTRAQEFAAKEQEFNRFRRDLELELLSDGFLPDAQAEVRLRAVTLRANQILQERHPELFAWLDAEGARISALRLRNEGIIAAGWAEQFALNSWSRRLRERDDEKQGEIES